MTTTETSPPAERVRAEPRTSAPVPSVAGRRSRGGPGGATAVAAVGYLALSLGLWWHVWTAQPARTTTCGCGDSSLFQWFLAWPAYAIAHGTNPWYSSAMFHPQGTNLLANTAVVAAGIVLAPVTWLAGPIVTFNVALGLAPVVSALAMYVLLRRFVRWAPAAFAGGLLYGFSPFVLIGLTDGHLMLSMAPMPPLIVLCLDEVVARQRRGPVVGGLLLAAAVIVQFFVGTEMLVMVGLAALIGMAIVLGYALVHREVLARRGAHAAVGLATAAVVAGALLAYPTWFALAGPARLAGPIWGPHTLVSYGGTNAHDYLLPGAASAVELSIAHRLGGYQAPTLSGQYLGIGLLVVLAAGLVVWRRDLRLWLFAAVGAISVPLSMGLSVHRTWTLWSVFVHLPLMDNVIPSRFLLVTYLCAAVMLGVVVDHVRTAVGRRLDSGPAGGAPAPGVVPRSRTAAMRTGSWVALGVALVALVPIAAYYADGVPFTTQRVVLPRWFATAGAHLPGRQVLLAFPVPFAYLQSALTWQAVDGMGFDQAGGGGPGSIPARAGGERAGQIYIGNLSASAGRPAVSPAGVLAVRRALDGWGVTMVVIPDPDGLPVYERVHALRAAVVLMTATTGDLPVHRDGAFVWAGVDHGGPAVTAPAARLAACGQGPEEGPLPSIEQSAACVRGAAPPAT